MGGAVSSGQDNNELVDNLMEDNYIRSLSVERVFRAIDRADYMTPESRDQAYKDLAWRNGPLHLSSPCIYSEVLEGLEVKPGLSFLNIGSGIGYLSTMVGLILGSSGISHGVEIHPKVVEYAIEKNNQFIENSSVIDDFDYCEPKYYLGNGLSLAPLQAPYDRVYCGAGCPEEYANYLKQLIRIGGILVMPLKDMLLQVKRLGEREWKSRNLLNVTFAPLKLPPSTPPSELVKLEEQCPPRLQLLARGVVRRAVRQTMLRRHPELREPPRALRPKQPNAQRQAARCPRRICIPIDDRPDNFNMLHDLDRENGANEMNALLSLVLSMGENRVAGALRFDSGSDSSGDDDVPDDGPGDVPGNARDAVPAVIRHEAEIDASQRRINVVFRSFLNEHTDRAEDNDNTSARSLTLEFHDTDVRSHHGVEVEPVQAPEQHASASDVPVDVEVYLDNTREVPGTSRNEVEEKVEEESKTSKREPGSDDDTEPLCKGNDEKRQKVDSGFGDNSPFSSSPDKTEKSVDSEINEDSCQSDSQAEEPVHPAATGPRRQHKRTRRLTPSSSTDEEGDSSRELELRRRRKRRVLNRRIESRRTRLSVLMKMAMHELPLPFAFKKYVNFGRRLQF